MTDAVAEIVIDVVSVRDVVVLFRGVTINSRRDSHRERERASCHGCRALEGKFVGK